jgi:hypothetical protein
VLGFYKKKDPFLILEEIFVRRAWVKAEEKPAGFK